MVIRQAIGDQRNLQISKVKQGNSRLGELNLIFVLLFYAHEFGDFMPRNLCFI